MSLLDVLRNPIGMLFTQPWGRIDATAKSTQVGKVSARSAMVITSLVSALMLVLLRFVIMDHRFQGEAADGFITLCQTLSPDLGEAIAPYRRLLQSLSWVAGSFTCYFVIPAIVVRRVFGLTLADFYLVPRDYIRHLPLYILLFLPVGLAVLGVAQSPEFQHQYPFYDDATGLPDRIAWELGYGLQFFALEFFFRGFMLRGMAAELGSMAVMVMMIPYCMIHFGKPLPECLGSILSGMVLGTIAMDTGSIWGGVTIHVAVAWLMDGSALWLKGSGL